MSETLIMWIMGGCFACVGGVFIITKTKVDKVVFNEHCKEQKEEVKEFWKALNKNNELLARVDERLRS